MPSNQPTITQHQSTEEGTGHLTNNNKAEAFFPSAASAESISSAWPDGHLPFFPRNNEERASEGGGLGDKILVYLFYSLPIRLINAADGRESMYGEWRWRTHTASHH